MMHAACHVMAWWSVVLYYLDLVVPPLRENALLKLYELLEQLQKFLALQYYLVDLWKLGLKVLDNE